MYIRFGAPNGNPEGARPISNTAVPLQHRPPLLRSHLGSSHFGSRHHIGSSRIYSPDPATQKSKTVTVSDFDAAADGGQPEPIIAYLVLRSWMLWRATRGGWDRRKPSRASWHARETQRLKESVSALRGQGGGTGSAKADALIRAWSPAAL